MAAWAASHGGVGGQARDVQVSDQGSLNRVGDEGLTPVIYAIIGCGSTSVVRFLLDRGANPNKADAKGFTPLHYATMTGTHTDSSEAANICEIAELLLSRGAYVDPICKKGTPLLVAAQSGNARMVELLLRHQANPNSVVYLYYTPLTMAIFASSVKCAELLIKAGADVNAVRPVTPLAIAASHGFTDCVKCLLEAGADANIPGKGGKTPAEIAVARGWMDCAEILSPLTSAGIDAMESDPGDSTLYAKRCLCWLHLSEEDKALDDANTYKAMEMDLSKSCYEQAAALILTKEYAQACQALMSGLKLDLRSDDLD